MTELSLIDRQEAPLLVREKLSFYPKYTIKNLCGLAAKAGDLDVLKWCRAKGYPWNIWTCVLAARNGHLTMLKWAIANGCPSGVSFNDMGEHLHVLKWLKANGHPWNSEEVDEDEEPISFHRLKVLRWAVANGCPLNNEIVFKQRIMVNSI